MLTLLDNDLTHTEAEAGPAEAFHITDEAGANWYARKLANIEAERARAPTEYDWSAGGLSQGQ